VLPAIFENFLQNQPNPSAAGEKIRPHIKFTHRGQYVLPPKFRPLGNTAYQVMYIAHRQVHATGEKGCCKEQNRRRLEQNKSAKTLCSPASPALLWRAHSNEMPANHTHVKF
jgi:hypothetical protein